MRSHFREVLTALLLFPVASCHCGSSPVTGYTVSFWGTTDVPANGTSPAHLFVTVFDDQLNTVPGLTVAFASNRGATDTIQQPADPTTASSDAGATGAVESMTPGFALISLTLNGEAREEVAPVVFDALPCTTCDAGPADASVPADAGAPDSGALGDAGTGADSGADGA